MGLVKLSCSNCGAELEFDEKQKVGYCSHCGTKHVLEEVNNTTINNVTNNVSNEYKIENAVVINNTVSGPTEESYILRAKKLIENHKYTDAEEYLNNALDINPESAEAQNLLNNLYSFWGTALTSEQIERMELYYFNLPNERAIDIFCEWLKIDDDKKTMALEAIKDVLRAWKWNNINNAIKKSKEIDLNKLISQDATKQKSKQTKPKSKIVKNIIIISVSILFSLVCTLIFAMLLSKSGHPVDRFSASTDLHISDTYTIDGVSYTCDGSGGGLSYFEYYEDPYDVETYRTIEAINSFEVFSYTFTNKTADDIIINKSNIKFCLNNIEYSPAYFVKLVEVTNQYGNTTWQYGNILSNNYFIVPAGGTINYEIFFDVPEEGTQNNVPQPSFILWWSNADNKSVWFRV